MHWIIWEWAEKKGIRSAASHILGEKNTEAGRESRKLFVDLEWMLCSKSLSKAVVLMLIYFQAMQTINFILAILASHTLKPLVLIH